MSEVDGILNNHVEEEEEEEEDDELISNHNEEEEEDEDGEDDDEDDDEDDEDDDEEDEDVPMNDADDNDNEDEENEEEDQETVENNQDDEGEGNTKPNDENSKSTEDGDMTTKENEDNVIEKPNPNNKSDQNFLDSVHRYYTQLLKSSRLAKSYNINPTAAIPIQANVNALTMSKGLQYLFLGGDDGYIRKYDFRKTMDGKSSLTVIQKHALTESVQYAGVNLSYWENEVPLKKSEMKLLKNNKEYEPKVSPVYSLAVQSECMYMLSGLENGGITMQGVRYNEGCIGHYFKNNNSHQQPVNLIKINRDEDRFLSAAWDKTLIEWDLQTGKIINNFLGSKAELSSLEFRPLYSSVSIKDIDLSSKSKGEAEDDDEMDSLFGDEDEDELKLESEQEGNTEGTTVTNNANEDSENTSTTSKKSVEEDMDEISKKTLDIVTDENIFLTSGLNGNVCIWDRRISTSPAINLQKGENTPPWCLSATWAADGDHIFAGRRNACVEEFDIKMPSNPMSQIKLPSLSGPVSYIHAMPNNKHLLCASYDNIRLYDTTAISGNSGSNKTNASPFFIIPGHHGGAISNIYIDPTCRFMISTSGNRGWQGISTDVALLYEIDLE